MDTPSPTLPPRAGALQLQALHIQHSQHHETVHTPSRDDLDAFARAERGLPLIAPAFIAIALTLALSLGPVLALAAASAMGWTSLSHAPPALLAVTGFTGGLLSLLVLRGLASPRLLRARWALKEWEHRLRGRPTHSRTQRTRRTTAQRVTLTLHADPDHPLRIDWAPHPDPPTLLDEVPLTAHVPADDANTTPSPAHDLLPSSLAPLHAGHLRANPDHPLTLDLTRAPGHHEGAWLYIRDPHTGHGVASFLPLGPLLDADTLAALPVLDRPGLRLPNPDAHQLAASVLTWALHHDLTLPKSLQPAARHLTQGAAAPAYAQAPKTSKGQHEAGP